uniref:BESS domain-containing protein n=1 Tax=Lygus hesperus TaxID=30085 RepID=A0A0A9X3B1_LYGHE
MEVDKRSLHAAAETKYERRGTEKEKYVHFDQLQFLTANLGVKRPRHSYKPPKHEPEEEYMELTPELPEERHFSFMTSVERPDYDEHEVPVAAALLPQQPEDLSYHPKDLSYYHHKELSYHKELEGDRMGNKMFLLSLLPIMERLPDHSNIRARLQLMEVLQTFVAHEDSSHRDFYNYHDEKQSCGDISQQHSTASHSDSDT